MLAPCPAAPIAFSFSAVELLLALLGSVASPLPAAPTATLPLAFLAVMPLGPNVDGTVRLVPTLSLPAVAAGRAPIDLRSALRESVGEVLSAAARTGRDARRLELVGLRRVDEGAVPPLRGDCGPLSILAARQSAGRVEAKESERRDGRAERRRSRADTGLILG